MSERESKEGSLWGADGSVYGLVEVRSLFGFEQTMEHLTHAIEDAGMKVFSIFDHAANARDVGMSMLPATVLTYGNPLAGTPLMLLLPMAALELPLRVLVRQRDDGATAVAIRSIVHWLRSSDVAEDVIHRFDHAQRILLQAISFPAE
jgi:uncharacterized protein (DUF302 family)